MIPFTLPTCHDKINSNGDFVTTLQVKNLSFMLKVQGRVVEDVLDNKYIGVSTILSAMKCFDPKNARAIVSDGLGTVLR